MRNRDQEILAEGGVRIGPFVRLRGHAVLEAGAELGNFVELKNARMGPGAKAAHLTYLGDAEIGAKANIGAGTITCNYDGVLKHRTTIGAALVDTSTEVASGVGVAVTGTILAALFTGSIVTSDWSAQQTAEFTEAVRIAGITLTVVAASLVGWGFFRTRGGSTAVTPSVDEQVDEPVSEPA